MVLEDPQKILLKSNKKHKIVTLRSRNLRILGLNILYMFFSDRKKKCLNCFKVDRIQDHEEKNLDIIFFL